MSPPALNGEDIMDRDPDSDMGRLVLLVEARLKRLIMRCGVPALECEDCIQEAWVALLKKHPSWRPDETRTIVWLLAVAHNKAMDFRRRFQRHPCRSIDDPDSIPFEVVLRSSCGITEDHRHQESVSGLQDGLDRLTDINRGIFIQHVLEGLTYKQIGAAMGLAPTQVKARYYRTLSALRKTCVPACKNALTGGGL